MNKAHEPGYQAEWRKVNPEKSAEYSARYRNKPGMREKRNAEGRRRRAEQKANLEPAYHRRKETSAAWRAANPAYSAQWMRQEKYGVTPEKLAELIAAENGRCPGCGVSLLASNKVAVDHDHTCCNGNFSCGKCIRGILCRKCNSGMGMCMDDPQILRNLANYLQRRSR
jgi:hypothetical protein